MARGTTLIRMLANLRSQTRLSQTAAHNDGDRDRQVEMLQQEQERLWEDFSWPHLRVERYIDLAEGQRYYAMPDDLDISRIERIEVRHDSVYYLTPFGIDAPQYAAYDSDLDSRSWPVQRVKITEDEQLEVWPIPKQDFASASLDGRLKIVGIKNLAPLVADTDVSTLDGNLIVAFVAADMLAAKGAKDAQLKLDKAQALYTRLKGNLMPRRIYRMFGGATPAPCSDERPRINIYRPPAV